MNELWIEYGQPILKDLLVIAGAVLAVYNVVRPLLNRFVKVNNIDAIAQKWETSFKDKAIKLAIEPIARQEMTLLKEEIRATVLAELGEIRSDIKDIKTDARNSSKALAHSELVDTELREKLAKGEKLAVEKPREIIEAELKIDVNTDDDNDDNVVAKENEKESINISAYA